MGEEGRVYITLDDQTALDAARTDPAGFVRGLDRAIIDEIQRGPELLLAVKRSVDEDHQPGRFLLTGSANVLTLPRVADSLAGRMETIRLLPLAKAEILGRELSGKSLCGRFAERQRISRLATNSLKLRLQADIRKPSAAKTSGDDTIGLALT